MRRLEKPEAEAKRRGHTSDWPVANIEAIGRVRIRPICPRDTDLYPAFANRISVDDRRRRFLYAGPKQLTSALLAQFTQIDPKREMAFVAIDEKSNDLLGVARMFNDPEGGGAEFAVVVRSDLQGKGLGARLMRQLIRHARSQKVTRLHGRCQPTTRQCCTCVEGLNKDAGDGSLRQVVLSLENRASIDQHAGEAARLKLLHFAR
jgi:acetyltransferase